MGYAERQEHYGFYNQPMWRSYYKQGDLVTSIRAEGWQNKMQAMNNVNFSDERKSMPIREVQLPEPLLKERPGSNKRTYDQMSDDAVDGATTRRVVASPAVDLAASAAAASAVAATPAARLQHAKEVYEMGYMSKEAYDKKVEEIVALI